MTSSARVVFEALIDLHVLPFDFAQTLARLQAEMAESERTKDLDTRNSSQARLGASATPGVMDYRR